MNKFVDDTTMSQLRMPNQVELSDMNACYDELVQQSNKIEMNANGRKTRDADGSDCERFNATQFAVRDIRQSCSSIQASRGPRVQRLEVDGAC